MKVQQPSAVGPLAPCLVQPTKKTKEKGIIVNFRIIYGLKGVKMKNLSRPVWNISQFLKIILKIMPSSLYQ